MKIKEIQQLIDNPQIARELLKLNEAERMVCKLLNLQNFSFTLGIEEGYGRYYTKEKCMLAVFAQEDLLKHCGLFKHLIVKAELNLWNTSIEFKDGKFTACFTPQLRYQHFDGGQNGMEFGTLCFDGKKWEARRFLNIQKKGIAVCEDGPLGEDGLWFEGKVWGDDQEFRYQAKVYEVGSEYGIAKGRISKLGIQDEKREWIVTYDRGWDKRPKTPLHKALVKALVGFYGKGEE